MSSSGAGCRVPRAADPAAPLVAQLLEAKNARPLRSLDELTADTFESDHELAEFLAFTDSHRDQA
ncbi:MAG: hypothetical protein ACRDOK_09775 [Streptosporangiaceae bacterium]